MITITCDHYFLLFHKVFVFQISSRFRMNLVHQFISTSHIPSMLRGGLDFNKVSEIKTCHKNSKQKVFGENSVLHYPILVLSFNFHTAISLPSSILPFSKADLLLSQFFLQDISSNPKKSKKKGKVRNARRMSLISKLSIKLTRH